MGLNDGARRDGTGVIAIISVRSWPVAEIAASSVPVERGGQATEREAERNLKPRDTRRMV